MRFRVFAAGAALLAIATPSISSAQDDNLSYPKLVHCAAFNMLLGQVMNANAANGDKNDEARADLFVNQAAALMVVATAVSKKDSTAVQEEVFAQNDAMVQSMAQEGAAESLMRDNLETCSDLGKAAYQAVQGSEED